MGEFIMDYLFIVLVRYAMDDAGADWGAAETQVAKLGKVGAATVVSVKKHSQF